MIASKLARGSADLPERELQLPRAAQALLSAQGRTPSLGAEAVVLRLDGPLDMQRLSQALRRLVARHDALGARIDGDDARQLRFEVDIEPPLRTWDLPARDVGGLNPNESRAGGYDIDAEVEAFAALPFDITAGSLWRVGLIRVAAYDHVLIVAALPAMCDAWSLGLLVEQLPIAYSATNGEWASATAAPSFADYLEQVADPATSDLQTQALAHWERTHDATWPELALPALPGAPAQGFATQRLDVGAELMAAAQRTCARLGVGLHAALSALWAAWGARLGGINRAVIAVSIADQAHDECDELVGGCTHDVLISLPLSQVTTLSQLVRAMQAALLDADEYRFGDVELLAEKLAGPHVIGAPLRLPRLRVDPAWDDAVTRWPGLKVAASRMRAQPAFALDLRVQAGAGGLELHCTHDTSAIDVPTAQRGLRLFTQWLQQFVDDAEQPAARLPMLQADELQRVLFDWNDTRRQYDLDVCMQTLFERQVLRTPEHSAIEFEGTVLTYSELNARANRLAHHMRTIGVAPDVLVGVCMERCAELVVAILAVHKAGGAYVPIDPEYPPDRFAFMLEDSQAQVVLTTANLRSRLHDAAGKTAVTLLCLDAAPSPWQSQSDRNPELTTHAEHLAYVIYTSGSTGRPKGAELPHRGLCNHIIWLVEQLRVTAADRLLQKTTISFDASVWEFFTPLLAGGTLVIAKPGGHRDPAYLAQTVRDAGITILQMVPSALRTLLSQPHLPECRSLRYVVCGGEALDRAMARQFLTLLPHTVLGNYYGPSEASDDATCLELTQPPAGDGFVPIGRPIGNARCYVLDANLQPVPVGVAGELFVAGAGVGRGYHNRPELTAQKFLADPFVAGARMYRTGDSVRFLPDGCIEYIGRVDFQVKIRGQRVEPGEVEAVLNSCAGVSHSVVVAREERPGLMRLVAYVVGPGIDTAALRQQLAQRLADYMVPAVIQRLDELPLLPNGKVNRHALPAPQALRPDLSVEYEAPIGATERQVCEAFAAVLGLDRIGRHDNFFELGGNSLLAIEVLERLARNARHLSAPTIFAHPTPLALALDLSDQGLAAAGSPAAYAAAKSDEPIALIGMAGRFPGANSIEAFWQNLLDGRDSITEFTDATLDPTIPAALRGDSNYVRARGVIAGVEQFDAAFFGIAAREAELMDPQHRVFLEIAWECLERAGYAPDRTERPVGVFGGVDTPTYMIRNVLTRPDVVDSVGDFLVAVGNDKDFVVTRVAHKLNLKGPAIAINTACSTSLVAVAQAVDSLRAGRCHMALAGGATVHAPVASGYLYQEGAMLSPNGHTRTFDAGAQGTAFSDGAAIVLLKRLSDALADGDQLFAVIRGVGVNNDGGGKASFTAPSVDGQTAVIAAAHDEAGVDPETISYVEAHGTATPLGDPVEVEALTRAFRRRTAKTGFCRIGSVKSNVGHLVTAAGAAGLIKTALALSHQKLPATINYSGPNPHIDFEHSPFVVADRLTDWPREVVPRRAAVSSFGVGGTNAHVVIEEAPVSAPSAAAQGPQVLMLSAKTRSALDAMALRLAEHLQQQPSINLADVAFTLRAGRSRFAHRLAVAAGSVPETVQALCDASSARRIVRRLPAQRPEVVLLFSGQGAQYAGMGRGLYAHEPVFRAAFDDACGALRGELDFDLRQRVFEGGADALVATATTQPATFCLEYALTRLWLDRGLQPAALIGHSVGEFVAAVIAGVMPLADAARLVAIRGRLMQALPAGGMLSVRLSAAKLEGQLPGGLSLAAHNGPNACVVAGPSDAVRAFQQSLEADGIVARALQTSHAFHSSMMDPAVQPFEAAVRQVALAAPALPIISSVNAHWMTPAQATDPHYWASHLREPVLFSPALETALARGGVVFVEVGPRGTLATLARQHGKPGAEAPLAVASLADAPEAEAEAFALASGHLWALGIETRTGASTNAGRHRICLPTYPFERKRHWLDAPVPATPATALAAATSAPPAPAAAASPPPVVAAAATSVPVLSQESSIVSQPTPISGASRRPRIAAQLASLMEDVAGVDLAGADPTMSFVEQGLDSLTLTQAAQQIKKTFKVNLTFRQLMESYRSLDAVVEYLDLQLPADAPALAASTPAAPPGPAPNAIPALAASEPTAAAPAAAPLNFAAAAFDAGSSAAVQQLIQQQMQLMAQQLALLGASTTAAPAALGRPAMAPAVVAARPASGAAAPTAARSAPALSAVATSAAEAAAADEPATPVRYDAKKAFGAIARIHTQVSTGLSERQRSRLDSFMRRYVERTQASKAFTERNRSHLADPRVVNGFRPQTKEIVYQIVMARSKGSRMWDLDGHEYVDSLGGFGMCMFGWQPDFIQEAVRKQVEDGYDIGPMHPLTADVSRLVCELTGFDRAALVNTGSEAVMGAIRVARTATARNKILTFTGSYHGTFDEVLVRAGRNHKGIPGAPGIMPCMFGDIIVVDYGSPEALAVIREHADDIAAVVVEPVQSRRPEYQPREFLHELRSVTAELGICLIFDEVITGFRCRLGGAQEFFGVKADIGCYGKVIGGGMPIGVIAGKREFMDALDGGAWQYGDDSMPTVGVTYLAGTFVRHPLALAAAKAALEHFKRSGPQLQQTLNTRVAALADELNAHCREAGAPVEIRYFSSLWRVIFTEDHPWQDLLFAMMRSRGVHILDNFPNYMTTAHSDADIAVIKQAFKESLAEMQESEFLPRRAVTRAAALDAARPPVPGARLGRDDEGRPAWFVPHPEKQGKYLKVES